MSGYWEPWRPEVGQRVRVRLSPECDRRQRHHDTGTGRITRGPLGHYAVEQGRCGVVVACAPEMCGEYGRDHAGHDVHVIYDQPFEIEMAGGAKAEAIGQAYAVVELEPLEEPA